MKQMQPSWVGYLLGGRYQVESLLRHGEISSIYHAIDKRTKRLVVIDIIDPSLSQQSEFVSYFGQVLSSVAELRHPMIQPISDFACSEEGCYVVLPHVPGDMLAQRLMSLHTAHLRLPFDDTIDLMSKLCEAVSYAHEHNIVHGELNPFHVIIDLGGEPVVTHFGMASLLAHERIGDTISHMNTAVYASPERISGQTVDRRADIYALGVILYEMIAGHPPFEGSTVTTVIEKHLYEPVPDIRLFDSNRHNSHNSRHQRDRAIPYGMMTVLQKALAKNPDERFWSVGEMANALQMMSLKTVVLSENELEDVSSLAKSVSMSTKSAKIPAQTAPLASPRLLKGMLICMLILLMLLSLTPFLWMPESFSIFLTSLSHGQVTEPVAISTIQAEQPLPTATVEDKPINKPITPVPPTTDTTETEPTLAPPTPDNQPPTSQNMREIPGGRYLVSKEPILDLTISGFWIDQYEVSNAKYAQFVAETEAIAPAYWQDKQIPEQMGNHPVQAVSWEEASAYCAWVNKRLPDEAEWVIAARGPYNWRFPWGNDAQLVTLPEGDSYPVGSVLENRSFFGVFDMAGNAAEWVKTLSQTDDNKWHVLRGGIGYMEDPLMGRISGKDAQANLAQAGFRCASSHVEPEREANILLHDDFSDTSSGWWQAEAPKKGYFYGYDAPDMYQITVGSANSCLSVHHEMQTDHIMIETELFLANPEAINSNLRYGVTVRATNNNFYAFVISPHNQGWQVLKSTAEGFLLMDEGSTETITGIKQELSDKLVVIANYSELTFFVNGELVSRVHDNQYESGRIGFMVETFDQSTAQLHVDSITVRALPTQIQRSAGLNSSPSDYWLNSSICEGSVLSSNRLIRFISHRVRRGQNLNKIARRYGVPLTDILSVNGLKITNANLIRRGQTLIIPQYE